MNLFAFVYCYRVRVGRFTDSYDFRELCVYNFISELLNGDGTNKFLQYCDALLHLFCLLFIDFIQLQKLMWGIKIVQFLAITP